MSGGKVGEGFYRESAGGFELEALCEFDEETVSEGFVGAHVEVAQKVADCY